MSHIELSWTAKKGKYLEDEFFLKEKEKEKNSWRRKILSADDNKNCKGEKYLEKGKLAREGTGGRASKAL